MNFKFIKNASLVILLTTVIGACNTEDKKDIKKSNPLLGEFTGKYGTAPFDKIKAENFAPAIDEGLKEGREEIAKIVDNKDEATFENTIEALESSGRLLSRTRTLLGHLNSAETNSEIQKIQREISPLVTEYYNDILLNEKLFVRIKAVYDNKEILNLDTEQTTLLNNTYKSFAKNGASLNGADKDKLREISKELSKLSILFGEHTLAETNGEFIEVKDPNELSGLPVDVTERAKKAAIEKGLDQSWVFTMHAPSFSPVMKYADSRSLRENMYKAYKSQGNRGNENDNSQVVKDIVKLRYEKAKVLGYDNYADLVLADRMADSAPQVLGFLNDILELALPVAEKEKKDVEKFMKKNGADFKLQAWDWSYFSNKLKKEKFNINDADLKPYFEINNVQKGMFEIAHKLFGLTFTPMSDIATWHKDVKVFDVRDEEGKHIAVFYTDYFPRAGKRGGAWMNSLRKQRLHGSENIRPQVINICNFTPPSDDMPSLLTFREVETMFHEFGHGLHGMLADTKYAQLSGTSVYKDFVELPSQILENWVSEPEALKLFAKHYKTGEIIPTELVDKILASSSFNEGYGTIRQLSFGFLDMEWHSLDADGLANLLSVSDFERAAMGKTVIFPEVDNDIMSTQFGHLFAGGYAAGYYSYKWAEVLDADAFEAFKENGIFDRATADSFKEHILTKGGTEHPMTLYKRFRGAEPTPEALARRAGFIK
ncbi:MAG: M3 family metallopeptidase [Flavobacteriales bacterium]|nr:M3 family metallopeptidase [Flavobacteriales bacterium]